jgi:hypothetical protein
MATAELSPRAPSAAAALPRAFARAYAAVWAATLAGWLTVELLGGGARSDARELIGARLDASVNPPPRLGYVLALAAHNLPIAGWPLLLPVLGAHRHRIARLCVDALLAVALIVNAAPVGAALAVYGTRLLAFIPQLPFEWAALALGPGTWLCQRKRALAPRQALAVLGVIAALVVIAAALETVAVPHR